MRNIKLILQYDGSKYSGWQKQGNTEKTIQGRLQSVLSKMTDEEIEIIGSGRTDAGVHAKGQVANFKTETKMSNKDIKNYLYKYLPEDIVVYSVRDEEERFHARYNAVSKTYTYKIWNNKYHDVFLRKYTTHIPDKLNIKEMIEASKYLVGEYDFTSFTTLKSKKKSKVREIYSIDIIKNDDLIEISISANGFLYNMVRIIVGTLIEVGLKNMKPGEVRNILNKKDRQQSGPTALPNGLSLDKVNY